MMGGNEVSDLDDAIRRTEAAMHTLEARMQNAIGDLDYESYLYEKRALRAALLALRKRRDKEEAFSQNSASSDRIKDK